MDLAGQVQTFVITILTGILLGVLFDCYRVLRGAFKPKALMTWLADLLYWLVATAVVFVALVFSNWGELRFYVFMGILSGLGLYYNWLSLYIIRLFSNSVRLLIAGLRLIKKFLFGAFIAPGIYCIKIVSWPFRYIVHKLIVWFRTHWPKPPVDQNDK